MSAFDSLPAELKEGILYQCPDRTTLESLSQACPTMHALYASRLREITSAVLRTELPLPILVDAIGLLFAEKEVQQPVDRKTPYEVLCSCLNKYRALRRSLDCPRQLSGDSKLVKDKLDVTEVFAGLSDSDLDRMIEFQSHVDFMLNDMAQSFVQLRPGGYPRVITGHVQISESEALRMTRALYRHEMFRLLFERCSSNSSSNVSDGVSEIMLVHAMETIYPEWEIEEIRCARAYLAQIFKPVAGWHESCYGRPLGTKPSPVPGMNREEWMNGLIKADTMVMSCISQGLEFACQQLRARKLPCAGQRLTTLLYLHEEEYYANYDGSKILFKLPYTLTDVLVMKNEISGQAFVSDEDRNSPNLAWAWCREKIEKDTPEWFIYKDDKANPYCPWGYVFWDKQRLEEWGLDRKMLTEPLLIEWGDDSPFLDGVQQYLAFIP